MTGNTESTNNNTFGIPVDKVTGQPNNLFKQLSDELLKDGWVLNDDNSLEIPYNLDNDYSLLIKKEDDTKYAIGWIDVSDKYNKYLIGGIHKHKDFLTVNVSTRNSYLGKVAKENEIEKGKGLISKFLNNTINKLNKHNINDIIDYNHDKKIELTEINVLDVKKYQYETYEDYPEEIQKEALEIIKNDKLLDNLVYSTNITHQGDESQIKNDFYSYASVFLKKPVHKFNSGGTGDGKTHLENETIAHIPDQYVNRFRTVSPKFVYYESENFHPVYNIFAFDDYKETESSDELAKELSDNEKTPKELKTVSTDRESETYTIPGYILARFNSAKQMADVELLNRFFLDDISNDEDHKREVKNKTKNNEIYNTSNSTILKQGRLILKCAFQYLIDKEITVFNPYTLFLDVSNINNRNIKGYLTYIQCKSFFSYHNRTKINDVLIGNFDDFNSIASKIDKESTKQNYKLTGLQQDIIKLVPYYTQDEIEDIQQKALDNIEKAKEDTFTYQKLAEIFGNSTSAIKNVINGIKGGSMPSLVDLGFLIVKPFVEDKYNSMVFIGKSENIRNELKNNLECSHMVYFENKLCFNTLNKKIGLIYSYINSLNILINTQLKKIIHTFCKNNVKSLNSYEKICNFLEQFIESHKNELIEIDEKTKTDFKSMKFHFDELQLYQKNNDFFISVSDNQKNKPSAKRTDNALNKKQNSKLSFKNNLNNIDYTKNSNEDLRKFIHKEFFEITTKPKKNNEILLKNKIIGMIPKPENIELEDFLRIVEKELKYLKSKGFIEIDNITHKVTVLNEFLDYYKENLEGLTYEN